MPYVVKKCENYSYGQNKWVDVKVTSDKEDAISFVRGEMYLLYASDVNLSSKDIDQRMNGYYNGAPTSGQYLYGRNVYCHGNMAFSIIQSDAAKYDSWSVPSRPTRTELLDEILS